MQEIIVFILFFSIIAYGIYRFFFSSKKSTGGGCDKCSSNKTPGTTKRKDKYTKSFK